MSRHKRLGAAGLAAVLVLGLGQPGRAAPGAGTDAAGGPVAGLAGTGAAGSSAGRQTTVTLITGDRVTVAPTGELTVQPAADRTSMRFRTYEIDGEVHVVPVDALALVGAGRLDRRLFNVTRLIEYGYDDAARDRLPMIVAYPDGAAARRGGAPLPDDVQVDRDLPAIGGAAVSADKDDLTQVWEDLAGQPAARSGATGLPGLERIWLDGRRKLAVDRGVTQIGAPAAYEAGLTGKGVTVAVIDSGVDATHPDLTDALVEARGFMADGSPVDRIGHGTHVASIIAGSGAASDGRYRGVAPDAELVSAKVCDLFCDESAILAAMHWAAVDKQADIVNMSLGGADGPEIDPMEEAVDTLTAQTGALFVVAAGNDGPGDRTLGSPGSADAALTVGAVDRDGSLADFSSRGSRVGDDAVKPDVTAPGVGIVAARADGGIMGVPVGEHYVAERGTSMAAPHVAGAAALLAQQQPQWDATRLKATLMGAAAPQPDTTAYEQGAGLVDVARAIGQTVTADPPSVSYGRVLWPHHDDEPITRTLTLRNDGTEPVTLDLAFEVTGPDGNPAPDGMFTTAAPQVTVAAGGTVEVPVTADTSVEALDGYFSGHLIATAGQTRTVVAVGVYREVESYDLTVTHLDSTGQPADEYWTVAAGIDVADLRIVESTDAIRLPTGRYAVAGVVDEVDGASRSTLLTQPEIELTRDTSVTFDARAGRPVAVTVPDRTARPMYVQVGMAIKPDAGSPLSITTTADDFGGVYTAQLGGDRAHDHLDSFLLHRWARPDGDGGFTGSPYSYHLGEGFAGRLPTGYQRDIRKGDLATVRHEVRGEPAGNTLGWSATAVFDGIDELHFSMPVEVPRRWTGYYSPGVGWAGELLFMEVSEEDPVGEFRGGLFAGLQRYEAGRTYRDRWNEAPYGPVLLRTGNVLEQAVRIEDLIVVNVALYGDAGGHGGYPVVDASRTALYRDGELVEELIDEGGGFGLFEVPAEPAAYRLEVSARRSISDLATEVDLAWTFRSGQPAGDDREHLPIMVVKHEPKLDHDFAAPAGRRFAVPLRVVGNEGAPVEPTKVTAQVSYDDGATWHPAKVDAKGEGWVAKVHHPAVEDGYVSLRTAVTDKQGNTVEQTVIRVYRLTDG
ncbi:S8 family serine peptidase [Solwaraspora sp. WMMD791]|uniref:S8 family serine peptidase n=1 Tax=Solwaraspora sp. WMMD791 TaxID=3016086 RepID=UPI00249CBE22|nr:S8 family serine peptidase [Solwaraspora sp. WMMD791]WFE30087.1 S8 family serine peptidase [Solwaraspora sp. WMMD791]